MRVSPAHPIGPVVGGPRHLLGVAAVVAGLVALPVLCAARPPVPPTPLFPRPTTTVTGGAIR